MSGVATVFTHEWQGFLRSGVLVVMVATLGVLGIVAALLEHRSWASEQAERAALQAQERAQWLALDNTHIHKAAHLGYFVIRDLPPGVILDRGVWDFGGSAIWLEAHRRNAPQLRAADSAGLVVRGAPRGVGPILLWITPLLLAILVHGIVAQERARGSLAFAIISGASARAIVAGKALAVLTLSWTAAALPIAVGAGLAVLSGLPLANAALWALSVLAALGVFAVLTVAVSSMTRHPFSALIALLLIWFAMVVVWPRVATGLTAQIAPIPSSQSLRSEAEVAAEGLFSETTAIAVRERLAADGVLAPNPAGVSAMTAEIDAARAFADIFASIESAMAAQSNVLDLLSWASPMAAADRTGDAALGLGDRDQYRFEAQAEAIRFTTQMELNEAWARTVDSDRGAPETWQSVVQAADRVQAPPRGPRYAGIGLVLWLGLSVAGLRLAHRALGRSV